MTTKLRFMAEVDMHLHLNLQGQILSADPTNQSRKLPIHKSAVVSVTTFHCGTATTAIAGKEKIGGTIQSLNTQSRAKSRGLFMVWQMPIVYWLKLAG